MARPIKWSVDLHQIKERIENSSLDTWARRDIEQLFNVSRDRAQVLIRTIGNVKKLAGTHFVSRDDLLEFVKSMIQAPVMETALRERTASMPPPPRRETRKYPLPSDSEVCVATLPPGITIGPGCRIEVVAESAQDMKTMLHTLALAWLNDHDRMMELLENNRDRKQDYSHFQELLRKLNADAVAAKERAAREGD